MEYIIEHFETNTLTSHGHTSEQSIFIPHLHNHYEVNLFLDGDVLFFIDGHSIQPQRGDLFLINNTQIHGPKVLSDSVYERAIIHFSPKVANNLSTKDTDLLKCFIGPNSKKNHLIHLSEEDIATFIDITDRLEEMEKQSKFVYGDDILINNMLCYLLILINREALKDTPPLLEKKVNHLSEIAQLIIDYTRTNIHQAISLSDLETNLNMNRHYLNRVFKNDLGISIYNYILLNKIALAKELLANSSLPNDVSDSLGFKDYSTFARAFKRITSLSPQNYIKSIL
ncbi:AraC family transcriptional regulator [Granulicatella seriolae]|uniref:AraC family transcriptional regulator n=1 Tax=Granulicatella seriolae TaxID=2967226 RepID=A0ABT1WQL2_9LACT|nr:AraC family transcriptional regulator [Granulicatella seriolae]